MAKRIEVPFNKEGQAAFAEFERIAKRLWYTAQEATDAFIQEAMPGAGTMEQYHKNGRYYRVIATVNGAAETLAYDYKTKVVTITTERKEERPCTNSSPCSQRWLAACGAAACYAAPRA